MKDPRGEQSRAQAEAAEWFTRLSRPSVTTQALRDFRDWRSVPQNREAYERVEAVWSTAGDLANDPDIQSLRHDTRQKIADQAQKRTDTLRWGLAAGALLVCGASLFLGYQRLPPTYESRVGEQRIISLADGSVLRLNTDSRAAVRMTNDERRVTLQRGEALFQVAHDASRPFVVSAGKTEVRAIGTVFDVHKRRETVDVLLLEGVVRIETRAGDQLTLNPNQRVEVRNGALRAPIKADAKRLTSWTQRRLTFERTPLADAVAEVNRYSRQKVRLEAEGIETAPVNGVFETGDAKAFASAVSSVFDLDLNATGDTYVLASREAKASSK